MSKRLDELSLKIIQDVDLAISVMKSAATWLLESDRESNKWWKPENMNRKFMLQHAEPEEFYVALVDGNRARRLPKDCILSKDGGLTEIM